MTLTMVEPQYPWLDPAKYSFSLGIEAAGAAWLAGQTASVHDPHRGRVVVEGDVAAQARLCWDKVEAIVAASGRSTHDVSEIVEYVTADGLGAEADRAAARPTSRPVSTVVVENLVRPEADIEVEVVAGNPDGLIRLPQLLPISGGEVVAPGDLVGQCRWVLEEAGRRLEGVGLGLDAVVRTVQQTTPATRGDYRGTAEDRRELLGPLFPASTGILTSALPHPDVLVAIDVWASPHPKRIVGHAPDAYRSLTFSPAVVAGNLVLISGTTAWDPDTGETVGGSDIGAQAEFVYDQIDQVCEAAGTSGSYLVKTIEYITPAGVGDYRAVGGVRERVLGRPYPASTGVVVAGLLSRSWLIEVEAVAVLP